MDPQLILRILSEGCYGFSRHAEKRMRQREIDHIDILNVLKNATAHFYVDQRGRSKAKCQFDDLTVIVEIMDGSELKVVTAWKNIYRCEFDVM